MWWEVNQETSLPDLGVKVLVIWPDSPKDIWMATRFEDGQGFYWTTSAGYTVRESKMKPLKWHELPQLPEIKS